MEIYLDSADLKEIQEAMALYPIAGVTTNPTILARSGAANPAECLAQIRYIIGKKKLFAQLTAEGTEAALEEAAKLEKLLGPELVFKVPMLAENLPVITALCGKYPVCATAVYTVPQAVLAAQAGAAYVAPYVSHLDAMSLDGPAAAVRMQEAIRAQGENTRPSGETAKILGASFRICSQIERMMAGGVAAATVTAPMLRALLSSAGSDAEVAAFRANWRQAYGLKTLGDFIR